MKVEVQLLALLNLPVDRQEWSSLRPDRFIPGEKRVRYPSKRRLG
jgi:hypothetical protein